MSGEVVLTDGNGIARLSYPQEPEIVTVSHRVMFQSMGKRILP